MSPGLARDGATVPKEPLFIDEGLQGRPVRPNAQLEDDALRHPARHTDAAPMHPGHVVQVAEEQQVPRLVRSELRPKPKVVPRAAAHRATRELTPETVANRHWITLPDLLEPQREPAREEFDDEPPKHLGVGNEGRAGCRSDPITRIVPHPHR